MNAAARGGIGAVRVPKWLERVSCAFSPALTVSVLTLTVQCLRAPSLLRWVILAGVVYLLPPLLWRLISLAFPLREGVSYLGRREKGSAWVVAHQLQAFYASFPWFERFLILVPGAYSAWLRLWGSRIGRKVYWTPEVQLVDRTHLEVGDFALFGNRVYVSQHAVKKKRGRYLLYFRRVKVGSRSFIGFNSRVGPGVVIDDGAEVEAATDLYPNTHVSKEACDAPA